MIVAIAAWLYIIQALLGLGSLFSGPFGLGGGSSAFATLLVSAVFGAMGYGLLKRETWGRWLALGVSLLSWVFGSLMMIGLLGALVVSGKGGAFISMMFSGALAIVAVMLVIALIIMLVSIVVSFKLFFYLCSQEGCEEFGVPYGSAGTVVASVGTWIGIMIGQVVLSSGGSGGLGLLLAQQAMSRNHHDERRSDSDRMRIEAERAAEQRQQEEEQRHAEQEARLRAIRDAENQQELAAASQSEPAVVDTGQSSALVEEAPVPTFSRQEEEEKPDASRILKCRDASGAVTFTQGYCPPGTQRVDMPKGE